MKKKLYIYIYIYYMKIFLLLILGMGQYNELFEVQLFLLIIYSIIDSWGGADKDNISKRKKE